MEERPVEETEEFHRGYQLVFMDLQRHIGLRNIYVPVVRNKQATNKASTSKPKGTPPPKDPSKNGTESKGKEKK